MYVLLVSDLLDFVFINVIWLGILKVFFIITESCAFWEKASKLVYACKVDIFWFMWRHSILRCTMQMYAHKNICSSDDSFIMCNVFRSQCTFR